MSNDHPSMFDLDVAKPAEPIEPAYFDAEQEAHFTKVAAAGLVILICDDPLLVVLDLDTRGGPDYLVNYDEIHKKSGRGVARYHVTRSRNGGQHVYIELDDPLSLGAVTNIQLNFVVAAALGSDAKRELLNTRRAITGIKPASVMFETTENATRLVSKFPMLRCYQIEPKETI